MTQLPHDSSGCLPKKFENVYLQRCMDPSVHCSTIHGRQDMETSEVSSEKGLDRDDGVHMYGRILLSIKK